MTALRDLMLDAGALPNFMGRIFDRMAIAEEEIDRAGGEATLAFGDLAPGLLADFSEDLYRAHVRELLGRHEKGEDMRPGTKAEALVILSHASLKRPPDRNTAALQETLFRELFPGKWKEIDGAPTNEAWPNAAKEIFEGIQKKIAATSARTPPRETNPRNPRRSRGGRT